MVPNPRRPRFKEAFIRLFKGRNAFLWGAATAGIALQGCAPVAQSILKGVRLAAPAPHQQDLTSSSGGENETQVEVPTTPVAVDLQKPLSITYQTEVIDALAELQFLARSAPTPAPSASSSLSAETLEDTHQPISIPLSEDEIASFQETGSVELQLPSLPVGTSISKITGRFLVIQQEQELIEGDEGFESDLSIYQMDTGLKGVLRTRESASAHFETASTLSRLVKVELVIELQTLGPVMKSASQNATTAEVSPSR